jgi:hypothetical protein
MTGTLTTLMAALSQGQHPRNVLPSIWVLVALVAGASSAVLTVHHATMIVPLLQLLPLGITLSLARVARDEPP